MYDAVDLFAGPGGWSVAVRNMGLSEIGLEWDEAACATRTAAGHPTVRGDVRNFGPKSFGYPLGLIASPPCPSFSMAGSGSGRREMDKVLDAIKCMGKGVEVEHTFEDERTELVLEPLRWVLEGHAEGHPFEWLAFEQVPTVLPAWNAMADVFRGLGYGVATGNLQAEQYGVPQTRKRAVLIASRVREVSPPAPTHSRYYSRNPERLDEGVKPWVSMAEALGWTGPGAMRSNYGSGGDPRARGVRNLTQPAPTMTGKADRNRWMFGTPSDPTSPRHRLTSAPAATVAGAGNYHLHGESGPTPHSARTLTQQEAAVLQSFPANYPWQGKKGKVFQQIGNAVPPLLAQAILGCVAA